MKKTYKLSDLDCACCAEKMQKSISKISGVKSVSINFIAQKITIEAEEKDFSDILKQVDKAIRKVEPQCSIIF